MDHEKDTRNSSLEDGTGVHEPREPLEVGKHMETCLIWSLRKVHRDLMAP
jgi:hypothetical protein